MKKQKEENLKTNEKVNIAVLKDTEKKENNENQNINSQKTSQRILSIDRFRGICMFAMVCSFVFGLFASFGALAPLIEHETKGFEILPGVSFADLFAPMFIFVVGLTIVPSFKKREEKFGTVNAYLQLAIRFLSIMGIGCLLNGFEDGWADVFTGTAFSELSINTKIYAIGFWVALALVINLIISLFTKNEKYKNISKTLLTILLTICGILAFFVILVKTGEKITPNPTSPYDQIWDTLQNIGLAGLISLPFVKFSKWGKLTIVAVILFALTTFIEGGGFSLANSILEGGFIGGFSWACILMFGSIFAELKDDKKYWVLTAILLLVSTILILAFNFTAAKKGCTPVYAMFTSSLSAMIWSGLNLLNNWKPKFDFFAIWGSNAILTYVVNYIVSVFILGGLLENQVSALPVWAGIILTLTLLSLFSVMNWLLRRKNTYIRI